MPWVGFEPTIPVFVQAKTVYVLDGAATGIGTYRRYPTIMFMHFVEKLARNELAYLVKDIYIRVLQTLYVPQRDISKHYNPN
jgi:hypothetical protein